MKILSVDDNPDNLYLIELIARSRGHEIVSARNGVEALACLANGAFDLIVSDILMPGMDGFQLCRAIKSQPPLCRIPFVFYTATYTSPQDEQLGLALGASRFVIKPVEPEDFLLMIEEVVAAGAANQLPAPLPNPDPEEETLSLYSQRLVRKLEQKIEQLDAAQLELSRLLAEKDLEIAHRRAAEEQLRLMWDASLEAMVLTSAEGLILRANPAFHHLLALPAGTLAGQPLQSAYSPESTLAFLLDPAGEQYDCLAGTLRRLDGSIALVEGTRVVLQLASGPAVLHLLHDVTARNLAEQQRATLEDQLRQAQKLECIGRLAGGIAHDFNNLLTVINGYSELVQSSLEPADRLFRPISEIRAAGERAAALTRRLLGFTRNRAAAPRPVDLNAIIREAAPLLARLVGEDVSLQLDLSAEPLVVLGDPVQLEQVLMNLSINARDAMPSGGRLAIATSLSGGLAQLSVSDDGEGMSAEVRERIFEPFFSTKSAEQGTGLGLSIVQGIVEQAGGQIAVRSDPGLGASFLIHFPLQTAEPLSAPAPLPAATRGSETILLVEDQAEVRRFIAVALEEFGYRLLLASGTREAHSALAYAAGAVDLVLTDVVMPDGNGLDLASTLAATHPALRFLLMSGYAREGRPHSGLPAATLDFIQKPFTPQQLARKVRAVLDAPPAQ